MLSIRWLSSLSGVTAAQWDLLFSADAGLTGTAPGDNPFCRHSFLLALEQGGSVDSANSRHNTGWTSQHLTLWQGDTLVAAVPGYLKSHSYGEYLFDWQIADAYRQFNLPYYPKWIAAIPFTPVSGPRLGLLRTADVEMVLARLCDVLQQGLNEQRFCSVQWLYTSAALQQRLSQQGFLARHDVQFLWHNAGYCQFDDYLKRLTSRKRKQIRHERSSSKDFSIRTLHGHQLSTLHWQAIVRCYQATYLKRSGHQGYISGDSFIQLGRSMADNLVVFAAFSDDTSQDIVAMALCFSSTDTLYGRYWGTLIDADCLHFELCYYQGIEYCISHQLSYFDAGAQGEHKLKRGFQPVTRYGSYCFANTPLGPAIADYFVHEARQLQLYQIEAILQLPYRKD
ncbi:GNAT family N-acetyltransferase [Rheinheimera gaetbuli]